MERVLRCIGCGYDLRGQAPTATCPECGLTVAESLRAGEGLTKRELALIAVRVTALWLLGIQIQYLVYAIVLIGGLLGGAGGSTQAMITVALQGFLSVIPLVIWWQAPRLAQMMVPEDGLGLPTRFISVADLIAAGAMVAGLVLAARGVGSLLSVIPMVDGSARFASQLWTTIAPSVGQGLIGLAMVGLSGRIGALGTTVIHLHRRRPDQ